MGALRYLLKTHDLGPVYHVKRPHFKVSRDSTVYQPLVQVLCSAYDYNDARRGHGLGNETDWVVPKYVVNDILVPQNSTGNWTEATYAVGWDHNSWPVPQSDWNYSRPLEEFKFRCVDLDELDGRNAIANFSIAALVTIPTVYTYQNESVKSSSIVPCAVDARWMPSELLYDPLTSDVVSSNFTNITEQVYIIDQKVGPHHCRMHRRSRSIQAGPTISTFGMSPGEICP
jgi:hypothetical protein